MKKKQIEKIPPLKVQKSTDGKPFVAAANVADIKGEKILIVDIYRNLKKHLDTPLVRICLTNKDFANYRHEEKKWDANSLENVVVNSDHFVIGANTVSIEDEYIEIIKDFTKEKGYLHGDWFVRIRNAQNIITNAIYEKKINRREELLNQRINSMPEIPEDFYKWCEDELMKNNRYILYSRKGRYAEFHCTCCGKSYKYATEPKDTYEGQFEHIVNVPRQGQFGRCEVCDTKAVYKCLGKKDEIKDKRQCYMVQKYGEREGIVVRYFEIYKKSRVGAIPLYEDVEINRCFFEPGMKKVQKDYQVYSDWKRRQLWLPHNIYGMANITTKSAALYPGSLEAIKGTKYEYCAIGEYMKVYDTFKVEEYMETYWMLPELEMFIKAGLYELADDLIHNSNGAWGRINRQGKTAEEILMIDKQKIKKLTKEKGNHYYHALLKAEREAGINLNEQLEDNLALLSINETDLENMFACMSASQIINRVKKYAQGQEELDLEDFCGSAINYLKSIAQMYADYITMRTTLGYDMKNQIFLYPRDLQQKHMEMVLEQNAKATEIRISSANAKYKDIKTNYKDLCEIYEYEDEEFCIRPAKDAGEIILEGKVLHHCVGGDGYLKSHDKGTAIILLLRSVSAKELPYITVEIRGFNIQQWFGANDKKTDEGKISKWLKEYINEIKNRALDNDSDTANNSYMKTA